MSIHKKCKKKEKKMFVDVCVTALYRYRMLQGRDLPKAMDDKAGEGHRNLCQRHAMIILMIYIYIYIYIYTIYQHSRLPEKKKKKTPGTRDENISNHRPGGKEKIS